MTDDYERLSTPTHEAGHIAIAWLLVFDEAILGPVTMVETAWALGSATLGVPAPSAEDWEDAWYAAMCGIPVKRSVREYAETSVMIWLAGSIAEVHAAKVRHQFELPTGPRPESAKQKALKAAARAAGEVEPSTDNENVNKVLRHLSANQREADAYREWLLERTLSLTGHDWFDQIVDAIVPELMEHKTLEKEAVLKIIHRITDLPASLAAQVIVEPTFHE